MQSIAFVAKFCVTFEITVNENHFCVLCERDKINVQYYLKLQGNGYPKYTPEQCVKIYQF